MSYPRQVNQYRTGIHDPLWTIPDGALVDGVSNGISDGTGGVVFLSGFENDASNIIDESRFTVTVPVTSTRGSNTGPPLAGSTSFANNPTDNTGLLLGVTDAQAPQCLLCTGGSFGTAFTYEAFIKRSAVGTPHRGYFHGINVAGSNTLLYFLYQDPGTVGYRIGNGTLGSGLFFNSAVDELEDTNYHHLCFENKVPGSGNRTISVYVDGVLKGTTLALFSTTAHGAAGRIMIYGNQGNTPGQFYVDEIRLTKGMYRYGAPFTVPTTPFIRG